ncbi:hypothetical protein [Streptomyces sp. AC495_CC817]|uniref:hypothetical protein n=1 Tax=Streptomyces sp. AC495_CC817 TaxID=2823900 RepID=UPI001C26A78B|nr:hypothetical protein [Streptomyces sp. AC495_CC817]
MPQLTDEELDRLLYAAAPARTPRDAKPDAAALEMLERIMATPPHPHRTRNRVLGSLSVAAAVVAAVVVGANVLVPTGHAEAATPEPLAFSGEATVADTLSAAQDALASSDGPDAPLRYVRTANWSYNVEVGESSEIMPQVITLQWDQDQSGHVTVVDGKPYDPSDAAANASSEIVSTGEVSNEYVIEPGQFGTPAVEPFGATEEDLRTVLQAFGVPEAASGFEVMTGVGTIIDQWTLTNAQESSVLGILSQTDGVTALGTSTDRLGRAVSGLRIVSEDGVASDTVLLSLDTGRIVGVERTNLIENEVYPVGAIIGYRLFDIDEEIPR